MNSLDIAIVAIVAIFAIAGYRKGLLRTVYRLCAFAIAVFISWRLYPYGARLLRQTPLLPTIQEGIANGMNLQGFFRDNIAPQGANIINELPIPQILRNLLHTNNTPDMFEILQVTTIEEYVSGFFANIVINGIAAIGVFLLACIALWVVGYMLDIVSKLPVIHFLNSIGGLCLGIVVSSAILWLLLVGTALFATGTHPQIYILLEGSYIAQRVFEATLPQLAAIQ